MYDVNTVVPVVAGLFLAAIGALVILLQIGIHQDRKERDAMRGFDDHQDNYGNPGIVAFVDGQGHLSPANAPMIPVQFSTEEIDKLREWFDLGAEERAGERIWSLVIAYDPVDRAIKFKINGYSWSPPMGSAEMNYLD